MHEKTVAHLPCCVRYHERRNKRPRTMTKQNKTNLVRCLGHRAALIDIWRQGRCELSVASTCCRVGFRKYNRSNTSYENVSIFESGSVLYDKMTTGSLIGAESVILLFPLLLLNFVLSWPRDTDGTWKFKN